MLGSHQVHGTVYTAVFRRQNRFGAVPFVHGLVHNQRAKGDLGYSRFRAFASSEGLDIFAPKVLERDEVRPWADLVWDLETSVASYWLDVETANNHHGPRPVTLGGFVVVRVFPALPLRPGFPRGP